MAISSYGIQLMYKATSSADYTKLVDVKEIPDLQSAPDALETTTTSDNAQTYILGIKGADAMEFTCNYTKTDYQKITALEGTEQQLAVWLGNDLQGGDGKVTFSGYVSATISGAGVNEVVEMVVTVAPSTVMTFSAT